MLPPWARNAWNCFNGFNAGLEVAGMTNHVGIGEVNQDKIETIVYRIDHGVSHCGGIHLRLQIISFDQWTGYQLSLLIITGCFDAAIEEKSDMGVFFSLRNMILIEAGITDHLAQRVFWVLRSEDGRNIKLFVILGHGQNLDRNITACEQLKFFCRYCLDNLAHAVTPEITEDDSVTTFKACIITQCCRFDELIRYAALVH